MRIYGSCMHIAEKTLSGPARMSVQWSSNAEDYNEDHVFHRANLLPPRLEHVILESQENDVVIKGAREFNDGSTQGRAVSTYLNETRSSTNYFYNKSQPASSSLSKNNLCKQQPIFGSANNSTRYISGGLAFRANDSFLRTSAAVEERENNKYAMSSRKYNDDDITPGRLLDHHHHHPILFMPSRRSQAPHTLGTILTSGNFLSTPGPFLRSSSGVRSRDAELNSHISQESLINKTNNKEQQPFPLSSKFSATPASLSSFQSENKHLLHFVGHASDITRGDTTTPLTGDINRREAANVTSSVTRQKMLQKMHDINQTSLLNRSGGEHNPPHRNALSGPPLCAALSGPSKPIAHGLSFQMSQSGKWYENVVPRPRAKLSVKAMRGMLLSQASGRPVPEGVSVPLRSEINNSSSMLTSTHQRESSMPKLTLTENSLLPASNITRTLYTANRNLVPGYNNHHPYSDLMRCDDIRHHPRAVNLAPHAKGEMGHFRDCACLQCRKQQTRAPLYINRDLSVPLMSREEKDQYIYRIGLAFQSCENTRHEMQPQSSTNIQKSGIQSAKDSLNPDHQSSIRLSRTSFVPIPAQTRYPAPTTYQAGVPKYHVAAPASPVALYNTNHQMEEALEPSVYFSNDSSGIDASAANSFFYQEAQGVRKNLGKLFPDWRSRKESFARKNRIGRRRAHGSQFCC